MKKLRVFKDNEYPFTYIDHTRYVVRGIILDQNNKIALNKLHGFDIFGSRNYYETPGGGKKDKETIEEALHRELKEETGYLVDIISELGLVEDDYNLIHRHNKNYYFLCKIKSFVGKSLEEYESTMIEKLVWLDIDTAIELYETNCPSGVAKLVKQREMPMLLKVKKYLDKLSKNEK